MVSTFPAIDTAVDNIKICEGLENIAGVMDRATLIRSAVQPDLGSILHSRHQYHWHTGYVPPQTVACPHLGAWMARVLGPLNPVMPAFINIGQRLEGVGEKEELKAFTTAGFFGSEYGPMNLPFPEAGRQVGDAARRDERPAICQPRPTCFASWSTRARSATSSATISSNRCLRSMDNAYRLLSSDDREAFDITLEAERESLRSTTPADSDAAACWRGGWSNRARGSSR